MPRSVYALDDGAGEAAVGLDVAGAVPGVGLAGWPADGLVALGEAGDEGFFGECGQDHAALLAVFDFLVEIVEVDDFHHRSWLGCVIDYFVIISRIEGLVRRQAHERVAVGGNEIDAGAKLFADEAVELRSEFRAAAENAFDAVADEIDLFAQGFEKLGRRKHALNIRMAAENGQGLIDAMLFVEIGFLNFAALEAFDDPAGIEIDAEGDAA